ncbi:hypothetical protein A3D69_00765 [Candidatus Uhrbacteria bacterium RIFCSPHIGHO2_02_FULL_54_11]|nr:MAG: hypothetical protein A3D69_00765 [Candidatus Uhrbacteria bacterium RIFCSPHIGHO2_02_FULL_54_11]
MSLVPKKERGETDHKRGEKERERFESNLADKGNEKDETDETHPHDFGSAEEKRKSKHETGENSVARPKAFS